MSIRGFSSVAEVGSVGAHEKAGVSDPGYSFRRTTSDVRSVNLLVEEGEEFGLGDAFLGHRVALAESEGVACLFDRVEVDGRAIRRADFVLAAVVNLRPGV